MLTKSDYIKYLQCQKYLWLSKFKKELLPEVDASQQRVFDAGFAVEELAYQLFPGGVLAGMGDIKATIAESIKLLRAKTPVIFQATVSGTDLFCRADIIRYNQALDAWDIIEVKSGTEVKDIYVDDFAFQKLCFEEAGFAVGDVYLLHINNQYVLDGDLNPPEFFTQANISLAVNDKIEATKSEIKNALQVLAEESEPDIQILRQCDDPYKCPFIPYCWKDFPEHSIYSIAGALGRKKLETLLDEGILEVKDIPSELLTSDKLVKHQHAVKHDVVHIEPDNIKNDLAELVYPLYFLDYETYGPAIPVINGYRPYQRVVFQYSLHVQATPGADLEHYYFLAKDLSDPTTAMSESLRERIGNFGTVIAWNMSFEQGCHTEMGERDADYREFYEDINARMYDLMQIFKKGYYVHKNFYASASLKKVLPVMVPELSYHDLDIGDGMFASNSWGDMVTKDLSQVERDKMYDDLLKYCELDTLAMVRILARLVTV